MSKTLNPSGRRKGSPKKVGKGWLVEVRTDHTVDGANDTISVPATFVEGDLPGVWLYDAGVNGQGQPGFKLCGDPDYLDELAEALSLMAEDIRTRAGWNQLPKK